VRATATALRRQTYDRIERGLVSEAKLSAELLSHRSAVTSASELQNEAHTLARDIAATLEAHGVRPERLQLEITESAIMRDEQAVVTALEELSALGLSIALDDFGTGYSSLSYLRRLPVDTLKIARAFVEELGTSADQERLVAAILRLGTTLGLESIAEGVETEAQRDRLLALRCRYAQGFLYSPPLPADELGVVLGRARVA